MTPALEAAGLAGFLVFCRIGGCLMLTAGFASARVPVLVRLAIALSASLALAPLVWQPVHAALQRFPQDAQGLLILSELAAGAGIGLLCRLFLAGLQFGAAMAANAAGLAGMSGAPVDDSEPAPALVTFISLSGTMLIFAADLHLEVFRALVESYATLPPALAIDPAQILGRLEQQFSAVFALSLRLCGPFILYAVVVNLAIGLVNKFTPQIPVYFALLGLVTAGGLLLLWAVAEDWLLLFTAEYAGWLRG